MKIREKFIRSINEGTKKREYRLNNEERSSIKVGDVLALISNTEPNHYVRVQVTGITHYANWENALQPHWAEDFSPLFSSYEDALKECRRYYEKSEVDHYGIVAFDIKPFSAPSLKKSSVLLDTNIVIQRESYNNLSEEVVKLFAWLDRLGSMKYLHPSIKDEIAKNSNEESRNGLLLKLNAYSFLKPSDSESLFFNKVVESYPMNENSIIDNKLLYEAYLNRVDFLITDDREMLRKAADLFIKDRVLSVTEYLDLVEKAFPDLVDYKVLKIKQESFEDCDLNSPFFESLRKDYNFTDHKEFDAWFEKKTKQKDTAYVYRECGEIKGFLYLKTEEAGEENYGDITPPLPPKRRLKVGTFKNDAKGRRFGERFLKIIFDNALKRHVQEIYVTLFEGRRPEVEILENLFKTWGFVYWGKKKDGEVVLVKSLTEYNDKQSVKFNFPLVKPDANYYFVPIDSEYHTDLFTDYFLSNEDVTLYSADERSAHRYALAKVYVSGKSMKYIEAKPGDVVVIYRMGDRWPKKYSSVVTGTAVIEKIVMPVTLEDYLEECKNVTVFSDEELRKFYEDKKFRTVIKLIELKPFENKVTADFLQEKGIIERNGGARMLQSMTPEQFRLILNKAKGSTGEGD